MELPKRIAAGGLCLLLNACTSMKPGLTDTRLEAHSTTLVAKGRSGFLPNRKFEFGSYRTGPIARNVENDALNDGGKPILGLEVETIRFTLFSGAGDTVAIESRRETRHRAITRKISTSESTPYRVTFTHGGRSQVFDLPFDTCASASLDTLQLRVCPAVECHRKKRLIFDGVFIQHADTNVAAFHFDRDNRLWTAQGLLPGQELLISALFAHYLSRDGRPTENHRLAPRWLDHP